jgi:hypothetical protein
MPQLTNQESRGFTHYFKFTAADLINSSFLTSSERVIAQIPAGGVVTNVALYEPVAFTGTSTDVSISVGSVAGTSTNMIATTDIDATSGAFILGFNTGSVLVNTAAGYVANAATSSTPISIRVLGTLTAAGVATGEWVVAMTILDPGAAFSNA